LRCFRFLAPETGWKQLPDFAKLTPVGATTAATPGVACRPREDLYGLRFTGFIRVPADGLYTFVLASDDGSRLLIGGKRVVDNDGLHSKKEIAGTVGLGKGLHAIALDFFDALETDILELQWSGPGFKKRPIPATAFSH